MTKTLAQLENELDDIKAAIRAHRDTVRALAEAGEVMGLPTVDNELWAVLDDD